MQQLNKFIYQIMHLQINMSIALLIILIYNAIIRIKLKQQQFIIQLKI